VLRIILHGPIKMRIAERLSDCAQQLSPEAIGL